MKLTTTLLTRATLFLALCLPLRAAESTTASNARLAAEYERAAQAEKQRRALSELRTQAEVSEAKAQANANEITQLNQRIKAVQQDAADAAQSRRRAAQATTETQEHATLTRARENYQLRQEGAEIPRTTYESSLARAQQEFPWLADPNSPRFRRAKEINGQLERLKSPLFNNPEKPYIVAHMVEFEWAARSGR